MSKPERPHWVHKVEKMRNCKYVGYYDLPGRSMEFGAFYVFYQKEVPAEFKDDPRYDNYFAIVWRHEGSGENITSVPYITGAKRIREAGFSAHEYEPGEFIVSRYRHDCVYSPDGKYMLDGGLAYVRGNVFPSHIMRIVDGEEVFEKNDQPIPKGVF